MTQFRKRAAARTPAAPAERLPQELQLKVELLELDKLRPYKRNARTHSDKQDTQLAASIRQHGFVSPVLVADDLSIVAGHGRVEAAKRVGLSAVPCIRLSHLSEAELRVYRLADNQLALNAGYDDELLALELQELDALNVPLDVIGFNPNDLDQLLDLSPQPKADKAERIPECEGPALTRLGDVWELGEHRLICGDARSPEVYDAVLQGERVRMVFADPPYNCAIDGYVGGKGKIARREFVMAAGEMTPSEFEAFLSAYMRCVADVSLDGAIHFHCMDWKNYPLLQAAGSGVYAEQKNLVVWVKTNAGLGTTYRSRHELIAVFKVGSAPHVNNFGLGETGRWRSNVWEYAGMNAFGKGRDEALSLHSTVKPVALVADAIRDVSRRGELVLDPFGGSGTTLIAAQKTRRRARLIELDPLYCDVICRRWTAYTGQPAILAATGETLEDLAQRQGGSDV